MLKMFQYRIFPTKKQVVRLNETLEECRWLYNHLLASRKHAYEQEGKSLTLYEQQATFPILKAAHPALKKDYLSLYRSSSFVEKGNMHTFRHSIFAVFSICLLFLLAACAPSVATQTDTQQQVTIKKAFQSEVSPIPTTPPYRCGAWSSNNAPGASSTITIYARITKNIAPVSGANATAVVHFQSGDQTIDAQSPSDNGGYVSFTVALQGQQPRQIPATVDVTFTNIPGGPGSLSCTPAFFTPH